MKAVSHFNLGIALELLLKLLTFINGEAIPQGHELTTLHDDLPPPVQVQLEATFQNIKQGLPASMNSSRSSPRNHRNRRRNTRPPWTECS